MGEGALKAPTEVKHVLPLGSRGQAVAFLLHCCFAVLQARQQLHPAQEQLRRLRRELGIRSLQFACTGYRLVYQGWQGVATVHIKGDSARCYRGWTRVQTWEDIVQRAGTRACLDENLKGGTGELQDWGLQGAAFTA